jgi:hypothetical protein
LEKEGPAEEGPPDEGPSEEDDSGEPAPEESEPTGEGQASTESPPPSISPPTAEALAWAPPALVNPKTIELGTGYTHTSLSSSRDYIVKLPPTKKVGGTWLDGGHNVVVIGGSVTVPTGTDPGVAYDAQRNGIYIKDATGTVHIEGVLIDGSGGAEFDGIDINAPLATVQLENLRIVGVRGGFSSFHADVVQPWGGVKDLRIDHLTGSSNYQGLMLQPDLGPIGSAEISNVDLTATAEPPVDRGGHMLWLTRGSTSCAGYPVALSNVFVKPRPGSSLIQSVWPTTSGLSCNATGSSSVDWPKLEVGGVVQVGPPPAGEFAPPQSAGLSYLSPGYAPVGAPWRSPRLASRPTAHARPACPTTERKKTACRSCCPRPRAAGPGACRECGRAGDR